MKLIGSRKEREMRAELIRSNMALRDGSRDRLGDSIESLGIDVAGAYIINWIPEQAEDIYVVVASTREVFAIEVPRGQGAVLVEREELSKYESKCSKVLKLKIAVAMNLLKS